MVVGERLGDVVVGALVQRVYRRLDAGVGGHDNAHHFGIEPAHAAQQVQAAAAAAQIDVDYRKVDFFALEDSQRGFRRVRFENRVAFAAQQLRDNRAHQILVLDHQHAVRTGLRRRLIPLVAGDLFRGERLGLVHDAGAPAAAASHS